MDLSQRDYGPVRGKRVKSETDLTQTAGFGTLRSDLGLVTSVLFLSRYFFCRISGFTGPESR